MGVNTGYNNYIRFILKSTGVNSLKIDEPIGWVENGIEFERDKTYHGIFKKFNGNLKFIGKAKEYIENSYKTGGINSRLSLTKQETQDNGTDIVWVDVYTVYADFSSKVIEGNILSIKFDSNYLYNIIKSNEDDSFELDMKESIDGDILEDLKTDKIELDGRDIIQVGESIIDESFNKTAMISQVLDYAWLNLVGTDYTALTKIVSEGFDRHSAVISVNVSNVETNKVSNMFYDNTTSGSNINLNVFYDLKFQIVGDITISFKKYSWNGSIWSLVSTDILGNYQSVNFTSFTNFTLSGSKLFLDVAYNEGIMITLTANDVSYIKFDKHTLKLYEKTFYESTPNLSFLFVHNALNRLISIITGRKNAYYSKYFGNKELGYTQDGDGGLIGITSGLWLRAFNKDTDKYKALTISLKDFFKSNRAVFNTGVGIITNNLEETLREEELKFFYQNEVSIKLPYQINNVKRSVDNNLFFSGLTFGYDSVGDYEGTVGLDEPNTKTDYVTPIRKTNKFVRTSKIRADDYGIELSRRKPQLKFPNEDTKYDEKNFYLDTKRTDGLGYKQKDYLDRLSELPTGIYSPETFRGSFFTPLRMLLRHSWVFRSGLDVYLDKYVRYIGSVANSKLGTLFSGETVKHIEDENILIRDLDRPRFLPEIVEFEHPVDENLIKLINGYKNINYLGENENIPNFYFKFEYKNENGNIERGYLLNLKIGDVAKWTMQLSNENIIQ